MGNLLVIPAIDIKDGKTVRVIQGIPELGCKEYGNDPVEMAMIWRAENSKMIHIVDFDGAHTHSDINLKVVEKICSSVIIPVQFAGGVRNLYDAQRVIETGVCRLVVTTMIIEAPDEFKKVLETLGPKKIAVSLDIIDDEIIIHGRQTKTGISALKLAKELAAMGIERFVVTDIKRNGMLMGPNIKLTLEIAKATKMKVTHTGGIRNKDELMDIQAYINEGIDSVIVGRALYENRFPCQKLWRLAESGIFN